MPTHRLPAASSIAITLLLRLLLPLGALSTTAESPAAQNSAGALDTAAAPVATLEVDAREATRGIERAHLVLPAKPGKLTLIYPKWLPGEHAPNGPIGGLSDLKFTVNGVPLPWQRDAIEMYAFHLTIPERATALDVSFEIDSVAGATPPNALRTSTQMLAVILWNQLLLYPAGTHSDDMQIRAKLRLPEHWQYATALPGAGRARAGSPANATGAGAPADAVGIGVQFSTVSLTTLVDSPVLTGRYLKTIALGGNPAVYLHLAADSAAALQMPTAMVTGMRKLVSEAAALFGAVHYDEYHFLWTLSDLIDYEGIEHHQSSDNRSAERSLVDDDMPHGADVGGLLPHEYTHSWNGKFRRPAGLATGNYDSPMRGELLWVYEGLTEYLGMVLSARSGLVSPEDARDAWADLAAGLQTRAGRSWRPLADTAIGAQIGYSQASEWVSRTRATDFYQESAMLWLEADALIRKTSRGRKSLDDFCKLFYGPPSTGPKVAAYDFDDVVKALNAVLPYDWRAYWIERLNRVSESAPLAGLSSSGWRLKFDQEPSAEQKGDEALLKASNLQYSLGFSLRDDAATVTKLVAGSPADAAGIAPGSHLIAVDGRKYSKDVLDDVLAAGDGATARTIKLLVEKDDTFDTFELHYAGHARWPRLERIESSEDLLGEIMAPKS